MLLAKDEWYKVTEAIIASSALFYVIAFSIIIPQFTVSLMLFVCACVREKTNIHIYLCNSITKSGSFLVWVNKHA